MENKGKVILDLCGGTGAWSAPYKDAGYDVRVITLPEYDVLSRAIYPDRLEFWGRKIDGSDLLKIPLQSIYGILAAPPCTMFSFARTNAKKPRDLQEGMRLVRSCLDIIWSVNEVKQATAKKTLPLKFWALENPHHGFLRNFLGAPAFTFDPWEFGDGYQKRTALWGSFKEPQKHPTAMSAKAKKGVKFDYLRSKDIHPEAFGALGRQERRAITPAGFARAFFDANR